MRRKLLSDGANKLEYEIRQIVQKAEQVAACGVPITWENIGDPIQKNAKIPDWIKEVVSDLVTIDKSYGYCHSKGVLETREFLADRTNKLGGVQITANDVLFFNGLGDAISKLYQYLPPTSRIIGPSPAYSTHSSAEAAHASSNALTYKLDHENSWYPDLEELYNKVKYNPNIVGILIINPDNPTGMIYPVEYLEKIVKIAEEFDLLLISDEIYMAITQPNMHTLPLAKMLGDRPGISLKGISKELPWPGSRCGWMEFYNRDKDSQFNSFCKSLEDAKTLEVCSTTLPQMAIPRVFSHPKYQEYIIDRNQQIYRRNKLITEILKDVKGIKYIETKGAFYNTILFEDDVLNDKQELQTDNEGIKKLLQEWITPGMDYDKRFTYYLLATKGICIVPISSFQSDLLGFRVTLLEENEEMLVNTFETLRDAINEYLNS
ncbi:pyridoxal phosphate-dependent aminotransferase [Fulvivirga maritima]|uniref:pyridoxal phosphate-dependent aminotransferase n=1 Tax=Fulvivirga maritima TaxID=2904247 RepID=UPI001F479E39|nr:pyridoxal phosphate-dependent aminotransferase [Fulvivirga maritima]UII29225.1 pyridoxal phosphate-dependent aminotransferase [Fulvivirga maritima]